jgi:hypothetical protein
VSFVQVVAKDLLLCGCNSCKISHHEEIASKARERAIFEKHWVEVSTTLQQYKQTKNRKYYKPGSLKNWLAHFKIKTPKQIKNWLIEMKRAHGMNE